MRPHFMILLAAAVGCFCRAAAQEAPHTEGPDSVMIHRSTRFENQLRRPYDAFMPLSALPDISGGAERRGLYSWRFSILSRDPRESCIIAPGMPEVVRVMGLRPIIPRRLTVSNGNAANWDNPYPSAYLDARTLSFPMRGIPRP